MEVTHDPGSIEQVVPIEQALEAPASTQEESSSTTAHSPLNFSLSVPTKLDRTLSSG
ncbi:hypothetical protein WN943_006943 [Citrus x changshan-huyou]